jgi:hypothetical protein
MFRFPSPLCALAVVAAALLPSASAGAGVSLAPHRAVYDVKLAQAREGANVAGLAGRMVIELKGSDCEGYTVDFRLVTRFSDADGKSNVTDLRSSTFETGNAESFRFVTQNFTNREIREETKGAARRKDDSEIEVSLDKPRKKRFALKPDVLFPTQHLKRIIAAALEGGRTLQVPVFDGSETGDKVYQTAAVIGGPISADKPSKDNVPDHELLHGLTRWPVTISYYETAEGTGEQTPVYEVSFDLYANGVSRDLLLDYGDFSIRGALTEIDALPQPSCP